MRPSLRPILPAMLASMFLISGCAARCAVKKGERVDFLPQPARFNPKTNSYSVETAGRIYEPQSPQTIRAGLLGARILSLAGMPVDVAFLEQRFSALYAQNKPDRRVRFQFANDKKPTKKATTDTRGWFHEELEVPAEKLSETDPSGFAHYDVPGCDAGPFSGPVQLLQPQGLSVVSTVEDTIQDVDLQDKPAAAMNLLVKRYQPVAEMPARYQKWKQQGAAFHYVSAIPRELSGSVAKFIGDAGYPRGSIDLGSWGISGESLLDKMEELVSLFEDAGNRQASVRRLLERFPERTFVLIGNSGLQDPEMFGELARTFPRQVSAIYIRETKPQAASRYEEAFRGLPKNIWHTFSTPESLPDTLPKNGA